ncbi:MAG: hypothetical protein PVH63_11395 [Balneolaceae bacterium]|jgi:hypothetical protein
MRYIAALDYEHLDNGVFLTSLARSISEQQKKKEIHPIIVHGDSAYTERIMQTGVMREEAIIRSLKDLNNRLVALFADQGVSTIGINPFQRNFITQNKEQLQIDHPYFKSLPSRSVLLLSTLVWDVENERPVAIKLAEMAQFLYKELGADQLFIFSKSDKSEVFTHSESPETMRWTTMKTSFRKTQIPNEFTSLNHPVHLVTARDFNQIPDLSKTIPIR